jgi:hypothetical protein
MELTTYDSTGGSEKGKRLRDQSEDVIALSSPVDSNIKNRRTQQVIGTSTAPGMLSSASGAFMMTQDKDKVFRLVDALSQEVLWMCDSRKELELIEYYLVSDRIVACVCVPEPETAKAYQLAVWDLNTGNVLFVPTATRQQMVQCINHAGTRIIVSEEFESLTMLDMEAGTELLRFQLSSECTVIACCFTHDDSKVAIVSRTLCLTEFAIDVWEVAPTVGLLMFSTKGKSPALISQVISSFNSQILAVLVVRGISLVDSSTGNHSLLSVTAESWYSICFGCDDSCNVALSFDDCSISLGVYRIADCITLFRVPVQFRVPCRADIGRILFATSSKIYLTVLERHRRSMLYVFDFATGAKLQQSGAYEYPVARLYVPEPQMILM